MPIENGVQVIVRIRPSQSPEIDGDKISYLNYDETQGTVSLDRKQKGISEFSFTGIVGPSLRQESLYVKCNLVGTVLDGINGCIMAYGQTGSGKTYSMYGKGWEDSTMSDQNQTALLNLAESGEVPLLDVVAPIGDEYEQDFGVIPRSVADMFEELERRSNATTKFDFTVNCQIMQIYNEKIYDLLQDKRRENPLQLRETGKSSSSTVHVKGLSIYQVYSTEDVMSLLRRGLRNRAIRSTEFNQESSRSHTILQLFVQVEEEDEGGLMVLKRSTFSLVDLAGYATLFFLSFLSYPHLNFGIMNTE